MAEENKPVGNIDIDYDYPADVLYCSIGPPQEAVGEEMGEGVVVRRNPETNAIVGITIVNFSRRFKQEPRNIVSVPIDAPVTFPT
jgi:uncharacterized protein YuzE